MPQSQRDTTSEIPDIVWRGPFGGIQSEIPPDFIEGNGFADALNLIFRLCRITTRPGYTALPALPAGDPGPILGIYSFFNSEGTQIQVVLTQIGLYKWGGPTAGWTVITGPGFTGGPSALWAFTTLDYKMCFSQGADAVWLYDGLSGTYATASASAVPANYLAVVAYHLLAGATTESGTFIPQRIRWTGSDDPTDWTSDDAGFDDLFDELGPITGIANVYQNGFIFRQRGITACYPTGIGTQPFDFVNLSSKAKGNIAPYALAYYGDQTACYVGQDNIYLFDGNQSYPIGDAPIGGNGQRQGARSRIYAELKLANLNQVYGFITTSIAGVPFNAYWLSIPNGSLWVFSFDEGCWTRFTYTNGGNPVSVLTMGDFLYQGIPRIEDLIGTIAQQTWSPATLSETSPLDDLALGFSDGVLGDVNFNNYSETPWSLTSGQVRCGDSRHNKFVRRARVCQVDLAPTTYAFQITNELGASQTEELSNGSGSGLMLEQLVDLKNSGLYQTVELSGSTPISITELALLYDQAGEYRGQSA